MKKALTSFLLMFLTITFSPTLKCQNLCPNPSFEIYDTCPDAQDQIQRATGWSKYSQAGTTPDYYNACDTGGIVCVPNGGAIHQPAYDGHAYAAVVTFEAGIAYREHIGIQLSQPLIIGQKYFLSFYTTMGEANGEATPTNKIGMLLSTGAYNQSNPAPINNFAHLYSTAIISDTINWTHVSGSIIADSAYKYCIIGNFFDNAHTDTIRWHSNSIFGYYAVDMVCISTDSVTCNPTGEGMINPDNKISLVIYPNPSSGLVYINDVPNIPYELIVYDEFGRSIIQEVVNDRRSKIDLENYPDGIYLLKLKFKNQFYSKKIIKF